MKPSIDEYLAGIDRAYKERLIIGIPQNHGFAHVNCGGFHLWHANCRPLDNSAKSVLTWIHRTGGKKMIELGPGAGFAAAEARQLVGKDMEIVTVSGQPINPYLLPVREKGGPLKILNLRSGNRPHEEAVMQECEPFIDLQQVGAFEDMEMKEGDFVYDYHGPIVKGEYTNSRKHKSGKTAFARALELTRIALFVGYITDNTLIRTGADWNIYEVDAFECGHLFVRRGTELDEKLQKESDGKGVRTFERELSDILTS